MFLNKPYLFQLKTRLRNCLKLRVMAEKLRNRFTIVELAQYKEGIEFKKILVLLDHCLLIGKKEINSSLKDSSSENGSCE